MMARAAKYALLIVAVLATIAPVYWMITISLKAEVDQFSSPPKWFAFAPTLAHYYDALFVRSFGQYLITSAVAAVASTVCAMTAGTLAAYALAQAQVARQAR